MVVSSARKSVEISATSTPVQRTTSVVRPSIPYHDFEDTDDPAGCDSGINRNGSTTIGQPAPDTSCQGSCRGGNVTEACGAVDTFISIYEYNVSEFLKMLVCLCSCSLLFFLLEAWSNRVLVGGRSSGKNRSKGWKTWKWGLGGGDCWRGPHVGTPATRTL